METTTVKQTKRKVTEKRSKPLITNNQWYHLYIKNLSKQECKVHLYELQEIYVPKVSLNDDKLGVWRQYKEKISALELIVNGE